MIVSVNTKSVNVLRNLKLFWRDKVVSGESVAGKTEKNSLHPSCLPSPFLAPPTVSSGSLFPPFFFSISITLAPLLPVSELRSHYKFQ